MVAIEPLTLLYMLMSFICHSTDFKFASQRSFSLSVYSAQKCKLYFKLTLLKGFKDSFLFYNAFSSQSCWFKIITCLATFKIWNFSPYLQVLTQVQILRSAFLKLSAFEFKKMSSCLFHCLMVVKEVEVISQNIYCVIVSKSICSFAFTNRFEEDSMKSNLLT